MESIAEGRCRIRVLPNGHVRVCMPDGTPIPLEIKCVIEQDVDMAMRKQCLVIVTMYGVADTVDLDSIKEVIEYVPVDKAAPQDTPEGGVDL